MWFVRLAVIIGVGLPVGVWAWTTLWDYKDVAGISRSHEKLGDQAYSAADFEAAVTAYERARSTKDSFHLLIKQTGAMIGLIGLHPELLNQNQATQLEHDITWMKDQDPSSIPTCTAVGGHLEMLKGNLERAEMAYKESLKEDQNNLAAHYGLALWAGRGGDKKKAAKEFEIVLEAIPDHREALLSLGEIRANTGEDDALELFEKALSIRDGYRVRLGLGMVYLSSGDAKKAEPELLRASQIKPKSVEPYMALGSLYMGAKAYPQAEQAYSSAMKIRQDEGAAGGLAAALKEQGRVQEALQILGPIIQSGKAGPQTLLLAAQCSELAKNNEQASALYAGVIGLVSKMGQQIPEKIGKALKEEAQAGLTRLGGPEQNRK